jgi:hypothetical protein
LARRYALFFLGGIGHEGCEVFEDAGYGRREKDGEVLPGVCDELRVDFAALAAAVPVEFQAKAGWGNVKAIEIAI